MKLPIFIVQFANEITPQEIQLFRGAVIASLNEKDILFHNHTEDGVVYRYPRIQYKRIHKKAAIICIKEGIKSIGELFCAESYHYKFGEREVDMRIDTINTYQTDIDFCEEPKRYRLLNWLPLDSENYQEYQAIEGMAQRITFLEEKLIGNLLSFFTEMGFRAEQKIELHITDITGQRLAHYKGVRLMAFDIEFKVNLVLPQYIGLGKSASVGFGTLTKITEKRM
jgi:hypothetical protein